MKKCLIISGGEYAPLAEIEYDYCIACDSGYENAYRMHIVPDLILGDFDSASKSFMESIEDIKQKIPVMTFPVKKDDTDTMLAIKHALKLGYNHIILSCCLGGRYDHTIANIQGMSYVASHGGIAELYGGSEWMRTLTPVEGVLNVPRREGCALSLFSLSEKCENLNISGAKYSVSGVSLSSDFPLGHGNGWVSDNVSISIETGRLLLIVSRLD